MTTIWDAITEGQNDKRKREQEDLQSWLMQQKAAADAEHTRATTRMLDENANTVSWERQQKMQEGQDKAYYAIQDALDSGDYQGADYLSRTHLGVPLQDITPPDNGVLPLTFDDEQPGTTAPASAQPAPAQSETAQTQSDTLLSQPPGQRDELPMYGPQATPDIMAEAASRDARRDPGAAQAAWMEGNPSAAGTPPAAEIEQFLRSQAAAKQQALLQAQPASPQAVPSAQPATPQAQQPQPQAPPRAPMVQPPPQAQAAPMQVSTQTYAPTFQGSAATEALPSRRYQAGDIVFDTGARREAKERAKLRDEKARIVALEAAKQQAPSIADFLTKANAMRSLGMDVTKSGDEYLKNEELLRNQNEKYNSIFKGKLDLENADHQNDMAEIGLRNSGSKDVANIRAAAAGRGHGKVGSGAGGMLTAPQRKAAIATINAETAAFEKYSNYPKLLQNYQRGQQALEAAQSGNPVGTGLGIEALISSHRGAAATEAFLKLYQQHQNSYGGKLDNFIEGVMSGDLGEEAKKNLISASKQSLQSIREQANQLKQAKSQSDFSPEKYGTKGNYEDVHDRLWVPLSFEPIKRDPNGGAVSFTGQRRAGSAAKTAPTAPKSPTIGEKLVGKKKSAEDMLNELVSK